MAPYSEKARGLTLLTTKMLSFVLKFPLAVSEMLQVQSFFFFLQARVFFLHFLGFFFFFLNWEFFVFHGQIGLVVIS
jgi:hypothetical protein